MKAFPSIYMLEGEKMMSANGIGILLDFSYLFKSCIFTEKITFQGIGNKIEKCSESKVFYIIAE